MFTIELFPSQTEGNEKKHLNPEQPFKTKYCNVCNINIVKHTGQIIWKQQNRGTSNVSQCEYNLNEINESVIVTNQENSIKSSTTKLNK